MVSGGERAGKGEATYGICPHGASLRKYPHRRLQERLECGTDGKRNVAEAAEDGRLDTPMQDGALQRGEQRLHEALAEWQARLAQGSADVSNEADGDGAKLVLLVRADGVREEGKEGRQIVLETALQGGRDGADGDEGVFEDRGLLAGGLDELKEKGHDAVRERLNLATETADDALRGRAASAILSRREMSSATHSHDAADVDLKLVVVVAVVCSDELTLIVRVAGK